MSARFGIHMGNSTVCLSALKEGKVEIVASKFGDRSSYAVVAAADDEELLIGMPAKQGLVRNGPLTVVNNFQFLDADLTSEQFADAVKKCVCEVQESPLEYNLTKDDIAVKLTPYEVAVKLLENLNENAAQAAKSETDLDAVLAVPLHYSVASRKNIAAAAKDAGFGILQILSEPAAALLAYEVGFNIEEKSNVLIYRLGGLSCDISLFRVANGLYEEIGSSRLPNLGGNILTTELSDFMAKEFFNKWKLDPRESRRTMTKLWQQAEDVKHILSSMPSAQVFIESLMDGVDWSQNISRARFENVIGSQVSTLVRPIEELLAKHSNFTVDKIIFCGGSMKTPKLQSAIAALFPKATVLNTIPADEVIAIGCGRQASFINSAWDADGEHTHMEILTLPSDVFVSTSGDDKKLLFAAGSTVPAETQLSAKSVGGNCTLEVTQGSRTDAVVQPSTQDLELTARIQVVHSDKEAVINFVFPSSEERLIN